jgi:hypothetical protein
MKSLKRPSSIKEEHTLLEGSQGINVLLNSRTFVAHPRNSLDRQQRSETGQDTLFTKDALDRKELYLYLDQFAPEVIEAGKTSDKLIFKWVNRLVQTYSNNYRHVRDIYRILRRQKRDSEAPSRYERVLLFVQNVFENKTLYLDNLSKSYVQTIWDFAK